MIASLSGTVQKIETGSLVVAVGGIGLRVFVPRTVLEDVGGVGRAIRLHTHLLLRENEVALYGFDNEDDLRLFETLLTISGIGPKLALAILSTLTPELLRSAVLHEEAIILQRVPGIGKKSSERILFALRDKFDFGAGTPAVLVSDVDADVIEALTGLGFSIIEAQTALQKVPRTVKDMNDRLAQALQYLDQP